MFSVFPSTFTSPKSISSIFIWPNFNFSSILSAVITSAPMLPYTFLFPFFLNFKFCDSETIFYIYISVHIIYIDKYTYNITFSSCSWSITFLNVNANVNGWNLIFLEEGSVLTFLYRNNNNNNGTWCDLFLSREKLRKKIPSIWFTRFFLTRWTRRILLPPPPQPQLPIPSPPPREREDNNREGWLSRGITWRKEERGMTGFIISRELIAPRLFIPSAHSACSSRLSAASFQRGCGQDTMRRTLEGRRHDVISPTVDTIWPLPPQLSIDYPAGILTN